MRDARDAEDALLLQNGDHAALIAAYHEIVVQRCRIAVRSEAGYDVAQNVFERLLKEPARGKRYRDHSIGQRATGAQVWVLNASRVGGRSCDRPPPYHPGTEPGSAGTPGSQRPRKGRKPPGSNPEE